MGQVTGISAKDRPNIFDPFFTTREVGKGTGLGLSICHGIITDHQGKISVKSRRGQGASFIIELPATDKPQQLPLATPAKETAPVTPQARILVVDDEETIRNFLSQALRHDGHEVTTTGDGYQALELIGQDKFDAVLLDIKMPRLSGLEIDQQILKTRPELAAHTIFVTGDVMGQNTTRFITKHQVRYITKPLSVSKLQEELAAVLSE